MNYKVCEYCGAHLDPGERCDCTESKEEVEECQKTETSGQQKPGHAA